MKKKKLTALYALTGLIRFALAAFLGFGVMLIIGRAFLGADRAMTGAVQMLTTLLCYIGGKIARKKRPWRRRIITVAAVVLSVGGTAALLRPQAVSEFVFLALELIPALALLRLGGMSDFPRGAGVAATGVLLANILIFALGGGYGMTAVCACAGAAFILCLLEASLGGLEDGARSGTLPKGMLGKNLLLLGGFVALCGAIALTGIPQKLISLVFKAVWTVLSACYNFLSNLFPDADVVATAPVETAEVVSALPEAVEPGKWRYLVYAFFLLLTIACVVALSAVIVRLIKSRDKREKHRRRGFGANDDGDEIEDIFDLGDVIARGKRGLSGAFGRLRRERFADMKTDESRVRFAFRELKRARSGESGGALSVNAQTPLELGRDSGGAIMRLTEDYSAMRYGDVMPDSAAGENAKAAMTEMRGIG